MSALIGAVAMIALTQAASADERIGIDAGGGDHVTVVGADFGFGDWTGGSWVEGWSWSLYGKLGAAVWEGRHDGAGYKHVIDLNAYPVLRIERQSATACLPYLEAAIGAHVLSHTQINDRRLSTAFQFGEFAGAGCAFGERRKLDIGFRVQHVSNGSIKRPNSGLTYGSIVFRYTFDAR